MNYCFIGGDSFEEDNLSWSPSAGQLVANHYGLTWKTFAKAGQGNFYILHTIIKNIKNADYKLALINWSSINRKDYINTFGNWQINAFTDALQIKDTHFSLEDQILFENLNYILSAQMVLEGHSIPYCMWWGINSLGDTKNVKCLEMIEIIKSKKTFYNFEYSSFEHAKKINQLSDYDGKHPNQEAHRRWSLEVIKFMESQKIYVEDSE